MEENWIIIGYICIITIINVYLINKNIKTKQIKTEEKEENKINIKNTIDTMKFFNELLEAKFRYYLTSDILAYFLNNKEIQKKEIIVLKENFFIDISNTLNSAQKENLLTIFSKEGIELYIHQTFLKLLNDCDIKYTKIDNIDQKTVNAVYNVNK